MLLLLLLGIVGVNLVTSETYECAVEEYGQTKQTFCVFRNVKYFKNTTDIAFKAPVIMQPRVAFENSEMDHLPREFLEKFGNDLRTLKVSGCKLKSVVITKSLEELHAIDNFISKVIVHQSAQNSPMKEIYLQSNRLDDISNITKSCKNLRILDLSRNEKLAAESELDLSMFNGFNQLEYLMVADVGALYLNNDRKVTLPSLTLLDLSMNSLLPSDLQLNRLQSLEKLEILRLNDNGFGNLDYNYLTQMKSLKEVYLEGNSFECGYLKTMVQFLHEKNVNTPVAREAKNCGAGFIVEAKMCCRSDDVFLPPVTAPPTIFTTSTTSATTTATTTIITTTTKKGSGVIRNLISPLLLLMGTVASMMFRQ